MGKLNIKESIEISTSANKAWDIIGPNFVNIADWGRGIQKSWANDSASSNIEGVPAAGRFCDLGKQGIIDEKILHYSTDLKEISWSAYSKKLPGFLKNLQNELKVESTGENSCRVSTNITADLTGVGGLLLGGTIKKNFEKLLKGFVMDWKVYAETGEVSEFKQKELARA